MHRQRDGLFYLGVAPNVGRTSGTQLWQVADLAEAYGSGTIRTTTTPYRLEDAATALADLAHGRVTGAAVLRVG